MKGSVVKFREEIRAKREKDFGLENALAGWVRRRWPDKPIVHVAHCFGLSESEAAKVVYGGASKNTLRKLLHHPKGGAPLFIELVCDVASTSLEEIIHQQAQEARNERARWEAEERRREALARLVSGGGRDDRRASQSAR